MFAESPRSRSGFSDSRFFVPRPRAAKFPGFLAGAVIRNLDRINRSYPFTSVSYGGARGVAGGAEEIRLNAGTAWKCSFRGVQSRTRASHPAIDRNGRDTRDTAASFPTNDPTERTRGFAMKILDGIVRLDDWVSEIIRPRRSSAVLLRESAPFFRGSMTTRPLVTANTKRRGSTCPSFPISPVNLIRPCFATLR